MPKVSVIIPIYNRAQYLPDAVNSVLNQSYKDFEIIIVDDGSTDNTKEVAKKCIQQYPGKISYFYQKNYGPSAARNKGIKESKSNYIAFLDSDDEWLPNFLQKSMGVIQAGKYQWVDAAGYRVELNEKEEEINRETFHMESLDNYENLFLALLKKNVIGETSKIVIRKDYLEKVGYFNEEFKLAVDWELWIRLVKHGFKIYRILEPLFIYKVRKGSLVRSNINKYVLFHYMIISRYYNEAFTLDPSFREFYAEKLWNFARSIFYTEKKDYSLMLKCLLKSQYYYPSFGRILKSLRTMRIKRDKKT